MTESSIIASVKTFNDSLYVSRIKTAKKHFIKTQRFCGFQTSKHTTLKISQPTRMCFPRHKHSNIVYTDGGCSFKSSANRKVVV